MFLTRGNLHHEAMWRSWFDAAAGLVPLAQIRAQGCDQEQLDRVLASCPVDPAAGPLKAQHLFNVYIHVSGGTQNWKGARITQKAVGIQWRSLAWNRNFIMLKEVVI
jgi:hypothetical protein